MILISWCHFESKFSKKICSIEKDVVSKEIIFETQSCSTHLCKVHYAPSSLCLLWPFKGSPLYCCHIAKVKRELMGNHTCALHHHRQAYWVFVLLFWLEPYLSSISPFVHISHRPCFLTARSCVVHVLVLWHNFLMNLVLELGDMAHK